MPTRGTVALREGRASVTRRRKPFRRPPDGPTRERESDLAAGTGSESSGLTPEVSTREHQTAEHRFEFEELAPPPFPTFFSQAANVPIDPVTYAQLHTASPNRRRDDTDADENPLIMMLRDHDNQRGQDPQDAQDDQADESHVADEADDDLRWKLELPPSDAIEAPTDDDAAHDDDAAVTSDFDSVGFIEDDHDLHYASEAAAQIDFLRSEIRRYQGDLERERLARTTAITGAQLAADARVEELIRTQRHEREQLDLINRQLLDAHRSESEARRSALIEEHRRQRANEHTQYQERIAAVRASTQQINKAATERFENELAEAHATRVTALQAQLDDTTERLHQLEAENRELRTTNQTWEKQLGDAESSLSSAEASRRDTSAQLTRQVQELQERLARAEQRLNGERKRTSELVANLLRESAAVASQARNADQEISSLRASWADERDAVVAATLAEARAIERAAAEREAHLEATIGQLRAALHGVDSSTRGA